VNDIPEMMPVQRLKIIIKRVHEINHFTSAGKTIIGILYESLVQNNCMKKTLLIASAVLAGTAAALYLLKRSRSSRPEDMESAPTPRSHHRTNVFAKAKQN